MVNFERDENKIIEAVKSGLISPEDFRTFLKLTGHNDQLRKGIAAGTLTKSGYSASQAKFHFERDYTSTNLKFRLHVNSYGIESLEPKRTLTDSLQKSAPGVGLQKPLTKPVQKVNTGIDLITSKTIANIVSMARSILTKGRA